MLTLLLAWCAVSLDKTCSPSLILFFCPVKETCELSCFCPSPPHALVPRHSVFAYFAWLSQLDLKNVNVFMFKTRKRNFQNSVQIVVTIFNLVLVQLQLSRLFGSMSPTETNKDHDFKVVSESMLSIGIREYK